MKKKVFKIKEIKINHRKNNNQQMLRSKNKEITPRSKTSSKHKKSFLNKNYRNSRTIKS